MEINTIINSVTLIIVILNFCFYKRIAKGKSYYEEKGKNLATKEDIAKITASEETAKEFYNKILEDYKMNLQKDFESHKYIFNLCKSLDNEMLILISECLKAQVSNNDSYPDDDDNNLIFGTLKLYNFLNTYKCRYEDNDTINSLINISYKIYILKNRLEISCTPDRKCFKLDHEDKTELLNSLDKTIRLFLPKYSSLKQI